MPILGHGIDLVELARIERLLSRHPDRFVTRCFTPAERDYCEQSPRLRTERYAARFAAKEATAKALGTGLMTTIAWADIEVTKNPATGAPSLALHNEAARTAARLGITRWHLSLTHAAGLAVASAVGES